jgi:hypothetical protein
MKKQQAFLIVVAALIVVVAAIVLFKPRPAPTPAPAPVAAGAERGEPPSTRAATTPEPEPPSTQAATTLPPVVAHTQTLMNVRAGEVLATVNGTAITLKDLLAVDASKTDAAQEMPLDMYEALLNRAIDRELVFQTARSQGIELTEQQKQSLEQARAAAQARFADPVNLEMFKRTGGLGTVEDQIAFELRDAESNLLTTTLAAKAGVPPAQVSSKEVEEYYAANKAEFGELPADPAERQAAWEKIDHQIRWRFLSQYQQAIRQYLAELRINATIAVERPMP